MNVGASVSEFCTDAATTAESINELIAIWANDRTALIQAVREIDGLRLSFPNAGPFLRVVLPCGNVREWTEKDVPAKSIQCHCEDLPHVRAHYFIKYKEAP